MTLSEIPKIQDIVKEQSDKNWVVDRIWCTICKNRYKLSEEFNNICNHLKETITGQMRLFPGL